MDFNETNIMGTGAVDLSLQTRKQRFAAQLGRQKRISQLTADRINKGEALFTDMSLYIIRPIIAGLNELFTTSPPDKSVGLTNVDKAVLTQDFIADAIVVSYGSAAAGTTDGRTVKSWNIAEGADLPAAVLNGEVELIADGKSVTKSIPLHEFFSYSNSTGGVAVGNDGSRAYKLDFLKHLRAGQRIEVQLRTADGVALPAGAAHFIRFAIRGMQID